jgi:hypothetical protein
MSAGWLFWVGKVFQIKTEAVLVLDTTSFLPSVQIPQGQSMRILGSLETG